MASDAPNAVFPPFDTTTFSSQLVWLAIIFVLLYVIMSRVALPRIGSILEERKDRIAGDKAESERLLQESEDARVSYENALAESRRKAQAIAQETRDKLNAKLETRRNDAEETIAKKVDEAEKRIATIRDKAMQDVGEIANETAETIVSTVIVSSVMGQQKGDESVSSVVDELMKEQIDASN